MTFGCWVVTDRRALRWFAKISFKSISCKASLAFIKAGAGGTSDRAKSTKLILSQEVARRASNALLFAWTSLTAAGAGGASFIACQEEIGNAWIAISRVLTSGARLWTGCAHKAIDILEISIWAGWSASPTAAQVVISWAVQTFNRIWANGTSTRAGNASHACCVSIEPIRASLGTALIAPQKVVSNAGEAGSDVGTSSAGFRTFITDLISSHIVFGFACEGNSFIYTSYAATSARAATSIRL